jgi:hypothetical protein
MSAQPHGFIQRWRRWAETGTWGPQAGAGLNRSERRRMLLVGWKPLLKGALRGFTTVERPIGPKLVDCPVLSDPTGWRQQGPR